MPIKLTDVPRTLAAQTGRPAPPGSYGKLWRAVAGGQLAAERKGSGWFVRQEDLPCAAAVLGMTTSEPTEAAA
jgi:hypothetical protein